MATSAEIGALRVNLSAEWADMKTQLQGAIGGLQNFGRQFNATAVGISAGIAATMASAAGSIASTFLRGALDAAKNGQEIRQAFDTAFGDTAMQANVWASSVAGSMRLSEVAIRNQATTFQNLFGAIAPTNEAATDLSERFVRIANDFANWKNISPDRSVELLTSALSGNARALRAYGVDLSEARVRAEAMRQGIITNTQNLSEAQAVLVRASLLTRELADAQGQTAAQAGSQQAAQQELTTEYQNAQEELGQNLLPLQLQFTQALSWTTREFSHGITYIEQWVGGLGDAVTGMVNWIATAVGMRQAQDLVNDGQQQLNDTMTAAATAAGEAAGQAMHGVQEETDRTADAIARLARQLQDGPGTRGGHRSWLETHQRDLERIENTYDRVAGALRQYNNDIETARRGGLDMSAVTQGLAHQFIEQAGGVRALHDRLAELPPAVREIVEREFPKLAEEAYNADDALRAFAQDLNQQFDHQTNVRIRLQEIQDALDAGLITMETYIRAKNELVGNDADAGLIPSNDNDVERIAAIRAGLHGVASDLADVATGTKEWDDVWKTLLLDFVKSQWIEPFLENLMLGIFGNGKSGGLFGLGNLLGGFLGFGGGKAGGGNVTPGMAYRVGERGPEMFVPDQKGEIVSNGAMGGVTVVQNIQTSDVNAFRNSRRQLAADARRAIGGGTPP